MKKIIRFTAFVLSLFLVMTCLTGCQDNDPTFLYERDNLVASLDEKYGIKDTNEYSKTETRLTLDNGLMVAIDYNKKSNRIKQIMISMDYEEPVSAEKEDTFIDFVVHVCVSIDVGCHRENQEQLRKDIKKSFIDNKHDVYYSTAYAEGGAINVNNTISFLLNAKETDKY